MASMAESELNRALKHLGPLEGRIMRVVWEHRVEEPFSVRSVLARMPDLAYTTVMTTLARLADKGILTFTAATGRQPYRYRAAMTAGQFLIWSSRRDAQRMVERYGDLALAAFADRLDHLTAEQRERLQELIDS